MFFRLLMESFRRQRRRKMLAGIAILLGTTAVTAMLALATTIGDRIHKELAVYGANIVVYPKADLLDVKIGGVDVKPATGGAYLKESDLEKLKTIFWANNITGISPELDATYQVTKDPHGQHTVSVPFRGYWFNYRFGSMKTGASMMHPSWRIQGRWPIAHSGALENPFEVVLGMAVAERLNAKIGDLALFVPISHPFDGVVTGFAPTIKVVGIVNSGDATDNQVLMELSDLQGFQALPSDPSVKLSDDISRVEISAQTKPEDAFARQDPDKLSAAKREIWYCRPYANSIAYQIREAIPGADAQQVRRVEQTEGTVLERISGLMWLISAAALLAAGFAVSAAMATAVLERRGEIGLMRSLGASKGTIALLFYTETGLLALFAGTLGYLLGSGLAAWLGARIFSGDGATAILNPVLLPVVVAMALTVAIAGSTPAIRTALGQDPSAILRADA